MAKKERKNPGHFLKGEDKRRHQLTTEERKKGGRTRAKQMLVEMHRQVYGYKPNELTPFEVPW